MDGTYYVLPDMIIVANESTPISKVGVKASVDRCVLLLVESQMPLSDSPCDVAEVLEVLRQDLAERQTSWLCSQHGVALHAWRSYGRVRAGYTHR